MARNPALLPLLLLALVVGLLTVSCNRDNSGATDAPPQVTWWCSNRAEDFDLAMDELPVFEQLAQAVGVELRFVHPRSGQYGVRFQLLLMTNRLPDIVSHDFVNDYPGGVAAAMDDNVILPLTDPIQEHAPNLHGFLDENPDLARQLATPDGRYFCVPSLVLDESSMSYIGPFVRQDLLEQHGLPVPQTLSDWETMLAAFAADPQIELPLSFYGGHFRSTHFLLGSYGIAWGFFLQDDRVAYGPLEPAFPQALLQLREWFQAGWIDPGVTFNSRSAYGRRIANRTVGAYVDYVSSIQLYQDRLRIDDPAATLIPVPYPTLEDSDTPVIGYRSGSFVPFAAAYLSAKNDAVATSMKVLDHAYSPEGHLLFNYGVLGESYTMIDGRPLLDERLFSPKGSSSLLRYYLVAGPIPSRWSIVSAITASGRPTRGGTSVVSNRGRRRAVAAAHPRPGARPRAVTGDQRSGEVRRKLIGCLPDRRP